MRGYLNIMTSLVQTHDAKIIDVDKSVTTCVTVRQWNPRFTI